MNRRKILSYIDILIPEEFVIFYIGDTICNELDDLKRTIYFCLLDDTFDYFSLILGIALTSKTKFVIVCEDYYLLRHIKSLLQISVSNCDNLLLLLLETGEYAKSGGQPTIYKNLRSMQGVYFNIGFLAHNYSPYFKNKSSLKGISKMISLLNTPTLATISVDDNKLFNLNKYDDNSNELLPTIRGINGSYNSKE